MAKQSKTAQEGYEAFRREFLREYASYRCVPVDDALSAGFWFGYYTADRELATALEDLLSGKRGAERRASELLARYRNVV